VNKKRLRILAKFLRNVDRKHFHLKSWCEIDGGTLQDGAIKTVGCGTTACAVGWAASIPSFRRDGFHLVRNIFGGATPYFKGQGSHFAPIDFFGLSLSESHSLFMPDSYPTRDHKNPLAVAKRIERLLAGKPVPEDKRP
jgi:hypothetical protein